MKKELLKFITAGSVDDGKSTLIGRLLFDTYTLASDQLKAVKDASSSRGKEDLDLAMFTDGLREEREKGITIDVAYRYFKTKKRTFILADCPGHLEYTRNMFTGASSANLAIVLIDVSRGIQEQTKRHIVLSSLLQIKHLVFSINKMDLVAFNKTRYDEIRSELIDFCAKLEIQDISFIPTSGKLGDNIVNRSKKMDWYQGPTLLYTLENVHIASDENLIDTRLPVQYIMNSPEKSCSVIAGTIASGILSEGDDIFILPQKIETKISQIYLGTNKVKKAIASSSVAITLENKTRINRGDILVRKNNQPSFSSSFNSMICWFDESEMDIHASYIMKHTTRSVSCNISQLHYTIDIETLHRQKQISSLKLNDIARISITTTEELFVDSFKKNKITGSYILIDPNTNNTVAAGLII